MSEKSEIIIGNCRKCERDIHRGENIRRGIDHKQVQTMFGPQWKKIPHPTCGDCHVEYIDECREKATAETATRLDRYWFRLSTEFVNCGGCGGKIFGLHGWDEANRRLGRNSYCSVACQKAYTSERYRRPKIETDCEHCGETFVKPRSEARFCSTRCRVAAHRARKKSEASA